MEQEQPIPSPGRPLGQAEAAPLRAAHGELCAHGWGLQGEVFLVGINSR